MNTFEIETLVYLLAIFSVILLVLTLTIFWQPHWWVTIFLGLVNLMCLCRMLIMRLQWLLNSQLPRKFSLERKMWYLIQFPLRSFFLRMRSYHCIFLLLNMLAKDLWSVLSFCFFYLFFLLHSEFTMLNYLFYALFLMGIGLVETLCCLLFPPGLFWNIRSQSMGSFCSLFRR